MNWIELLTVVVGCRRLNYAIDLDLRLHDALGKLTTACAKRTTNVPRKFRAATQVWTVGTDKCLGVGRASIETASTLIHGARRALRRVIVRRLCRVWDTRTALLRKLDLGNREASFFLRLALLPHQIRHALATSVLVGDRVKNVVGATFWAKAVRKFMYGVSCFVIVALFLCCVSQVKRLAEDGPCGNVP